MEITKVLTFDSGHRLSNYDGKCKNLHGHTYTLRITVEGDLDEMGMVMDFGDLKRIFKETVDARFDHKTMLLKTDPENQKLKDVVPDEWITWVDYNPTAENIATDIFEILETELKKIDVRLKEVELWETPTSFARVSK